MTDETSEQQQEREAARRRAWWSEREDAYRQRPEIQAEIAERQADIDERNATALRYEERMARKAAAGVPGAQDALNQHYTLDACETDPPEPSAKDDPDEWLDFYREFEGRELPLHAQDAAERHRIAANAPADVGGMAADYYEANEPSLHPDDLAAEWAGLSLEQLRAERELDWDAG